MNELTPELQLTAQPDETADEMSVLSAASAQPAFEPLVDELRSENDRLRSELRTITARNELTHLLNAERARSPELLFETSRDRLTFDEDGKLTGTDDLIADLKTRFPEQFVGDNDLDSAAIIQGLPGTGKGFQSAIRNPHSALGMPSINSGAGRSSGRPPLTKEQLARMRPREITRLDWNDVRQVLSS